MSRAMQGSIMDRKLPPQRAFRLARKVSRYKPSIIYADESLSKPLSPQEQMWLGPNTALVTCTNYCLT